MSPVRRWAALLSLSAAFVAAVAAQAGESKRLRILTSLPVLYSWAANVAGDRAEVDNLLPADIGPHDFQFRPADVRKLTAADLVIVNGLGIENWLSGMIANNAQPGASNRIVRVSDGLKAELIYHVPDIDLGGTGSGHHHHHDHEAAGEAPNPHTWLDPVFARHGVSNIVAALVRADPEGEATYRVNAARYLDELIRLDGEIRTVVDQLKRKQVVTFHDAFPYFCRRYGLELVGVIEEVPSVEPSPKYLARLINAIRARDVRVIFTEPQFNPRLVERIAKDLDAVVASLDVLETGRPSREFYLEGMRRNLRTLERTLK
jgi:zinc transport system substrate-binding protein